MPLTLHSRRGVTLLDLLVAVVLAALLAAPLLRLMLGQQRVAVASAERTSVRNSLIIAASFLTAAVREVATGPLDSDLMEASSNRLVFRAMRGFGVACTRSGNTLVIPAGSVPAGRPPRAAKDSLAVLLQADSGGASDRWVALPIRAVAAGGSCDGRPALEITVALDTLRTDPLIALPTPVRVFEVLEVRGYVESGALWLGARSLSAGELIQPVAGPFVGGGITFSPLDRSGSLTNDPRQVASIGVRLVARTERPVSLSGEDRRFVADSIIFRVGVRNADGP
jgi:hypothetical protein